jgi:hypothetical protein
VWCRHPKTARQHATPNAKAIIATEKNPPRDLRLVVPLGRTVALPSASNPTIVVITAVFFFFFFFFVVVVVVVVLSLFFL